MRNLTSMIQLDRNRHQRDAHEQPRHTRRLEDRASTADRARGEVSMGGEWLVPW
jgi:hypothetical protein